MKTPQEQLEQHLKEGRQLCVGMACMASMGLLLVAEATLPAWGITCVLCAVLTVLIAFKLYQEQQSK